MIIPMMVGKLTAAACALVVAHVKVQGDERELMEKSEVEQTV